MVSRGSQFIVATLVIGTALFAGCAKRPATTAASAPAPTGTAATTGATGGATQPGMAPSTTAPAAPATPATPAAPTARPQPKEFVAVADLKPIYFDFDKYDIRPGDAKVLDANAQWLKSNANQLVLIEGHADERGTNEYNLALGERRAKSTRTTSSRRAFRRAASPSSATVRSVRPARRRRKSAGARTAAPSSSSSPANDG